MISEGIVKDITNWSKSLPNVLKFFVLCLAIMLIGVFSILYFEGETIERIITAHDSNKYGVVNNKKVADTVEYWRTLV